MSKILEKQRLHANDGMGRAQNNNLAVQILVKEVWPC